ncbi:opticin isoform X2 [Cygnus olor]|uniref:opticin isoform X2 n=1 Tax=Cygnus olor TaxID=8869 RepID=UPI001ADEBDF9|nr:opticin isoform X2 [Cygnus olor]
MRSLAGAGGEERERAWGDTLCSPPLLPLPGSLGPLGGGFRCFAHCKTAFFCFLLLLFLLWNKNEGVQVSPGCNAAVLGNLASPPLPWEPLGPEQSRPSAALLGGLPSCLRCLCIGTSVYCDDADLEHIPLLPPDTTYLYARFNRISAIWAGDFTGLKKLKRIDLTSNSISWADADAFRLLPSLQELILPENRLTALPELPRSIVRLDARLNRIPSTGLQPEAFRDLKQLQFLHLSDNQLDYVPTPLPESLRSLHLQNNNIQTMHKDTFCDSQDHSHIRRALEDIRLDGNPINLSLFPNAYFCLPRLPTGRFA